MSEIEDQLEKLPRLNEFKKKNSINKEKLSFAGLFCGISYETNLHDCDKILLIFQPFCILQRQTGNFILIPYTIP